MFKPNQIKQITNPVGENVVIIGGDRLFYQGRGNRVDIAFTGKYLSVFYVASNAGIGYVNYGRFRIDYANSTGGYSYGSGRANYWCWAILRSCSSLSIRNGSNVFLKYPND